MSASLGLYMRVRVCACASTRVRTFEVRVQNYSLHLRHSCEVQERYESCHRFCDPLAPIAKHTHCRPSQCPMPALEWPRSPEDLLGAKRFQHSSCVGLCAAANHIAATVGGTSRLSSQAWSAATGTNAAAYTGAGCRHMRWAPPSTLKNCVTTGETDMPGGGREEEKEGSKKQGSEGGRKRGRE